MIDILYIESIIVFCLHSFHLIEFQNPFFEADDTFELALKGTGHPTDLSADCTESLFSLFRPTESALKFLIEAK
jgi:hypothetical protein